jgi:hypothetical protein
MFFLNPIRFSRSIRFWCLMVFCLMLSTVGVHAEDSLQVADTVEYREPKKYILGFFYELGGYLGSYHNLAEQRDDSTNPFSMGSYSKHLCAELGCCFGSLVCLTSYIEFGSAESYDAKDYDEVANRERWGVRISCSIMQRYLHFIPEVGWVFWDEEALIYDTEKTKPDLYHEEYRDDGLSYGLASRVGIITKEVEGDELGLYLYGRYVHDDVVIPADNYWMELQFFARVLQPKPTPVTEPPFYQVYLALGARWTKRTDGRSESYISLRLGGIMGIF